MPVAQLDRVLDSDSSGCRFEPCQARHKNKEDIHWVVDVFLYFKAGIIYLDVSKLWMIMKKGMV